MRVIVALKDDARPEHLGRLHVVTATMGVSEFRDIWYSISLSTYKTTLESPFYIYITPYDDDITSIKVYAKSPSGNIYTYFLSDTGRYLIDTEVGIWTIYASVENQAGIYEASRPDDFVTIEITPITFDALFPGIG